MSNPPAQASRQPPANPLAGILGSFTEPDKLGNALQKAASVANIVGPIVVGAIPLGCEVAIAAVRLDGGEKSPDVYSVGAGKFGLSRPAIDRIALAAGVDTVSSVRGTMTGNYCEWTVVRQVRGLDGTPVRATGSRVIDLRPGSPYRKSLQAKARASQKEPDSQVNEILNMLGAHAETKARLRADRALLGIRTYTKEELARPFIVAKIIFTGRCAHNPAMEAMFAGQIAHSMLGGTAALYGSMPMMAPQPPMPMMGGFGPMAALPMGPGGGQPPALPAAPPIDDFADDDDVGGGGGGEPPAPTVPNEVLVARLDWKGIASAGDFEVKLGKDKGKKLSDVRDTRWLRGVLEGDLLNPAKQQYHGLIMRQLKAIYDIMHRDGEWTPLDGPPPGSDGPQGPPAGGGAEFDGPPDPEQDGR